MRKEKEKHFYVAAGRIKNIFAAEVRKMNENNFFTPFFSSS